MERSGSCRQYGDIGEPALWLPKIASLSKALLNNFHIAATRTSISRGTAMSGKYAFIQSLKEVRFLFCQTSDHSAATRFQVPLHRFLQSLILIHYRSFLTRAYPTMKKNNPHTPIMIREALGTEPRVWARYGKLQRRTQRNIAYGCCP